MSDIVQNAEETPRRRRDAAATRQAIEEAARSLFATRGYANTGVRDIATLAGVNSSLVGRHFGTKAALFRTVVSAILDLRPLLANGPERFGGHVIDLFRSSQAASSPLMMLLLSMGDPEASAISAELMRNSVIAPLAIWLGEPDGLFRARRLAVLWSGYLTQTCLLPDTPADEIRAVEIWIARITQAIVDEGRPAVSE